MNACLPETTENHLRSITSWVFTYAKAAVRRDWDKTTPRVTEEERATFRESLDRNLDIKGPSVFVDVQLPDGKIKEYVPRKGEREMVMVPSYRDKESSLSKICTALKTTAYASLSYIARETSLSAEDVKAFINSRPEVFRQSLMRTEGGEEVYMMNTPLSGILDAWRAFRHLNAKKY